MDFLKIRTLSKAYASNPAPVLQDINITIPEGESVALVGANGAGKSTLLKILLGHVQATNGLVELMGHPAGTPQSLERVGYLPELPSFWGEFSARELLSQLALLRKIDNIVAAKRIEQLLKILGLQQRSSRRMEGYSKGMLQRTGIAAALINDPDFIVLDEPMSGLDPRAQEKLRNIIAKLKEAGKSFLISSHALEDIRSFCDRVLVLERSKLVMDGPTDEVLDQLLEKYRSSEPWDEDPLGEIPQNWTLV